MLFGFGWWLSGVSVDDGSVGLALVFESQDCFDAGSDRSGSAFVGSACDETVEVREERLGKPDGYLFGGHSASIPDWDARRYSVYACSGGLDGQGMRLVRGRLHALAGDFLTPLPDGDVGVHLGQGLSIPLDPERWVERACEVVGRDMRQVEWDRYVPGEIERQSACGWTIVETAEDEAG